MDLTPSQVIQKSLTPPSPSNNNQTQMGNESLRIGPATIQDQNSTQQAHENKNDGSDGPKKRQRNRKKKQQPQKQQSSSSGRNQDTCVIDPMSSTTPVEHDSNSIKQSSSTTQHLQSSKKKNRNRSNNKNNNKLKQNTNESQEDHISNNTKQIDQQQLQEQQQQKKKKPNKQSQNDNENIKKKSSNRNRGKKKTNQNQQLSFWKSHVPDDAVDPITLDPIRDLKYPPFALVANEPYIPIEEWPTTISVSRKDSKLHNQSRETEEERQRRILAEQWGEKHAVGSVTTLKQETDDQDYTTIHEKRHVNLYDGRALAYYMVSQLQFIDPLNRRDLTRDEINNLDSYLRRNGFHDLNVTEAYDAKGITLSTAGAAANTAAGRAAILQQEARNLLNALFGNSSVTHTGSAHYNSNTNTLMQQYMAHEAVSSEQRSHRRSVRNNGSPRRSPTNDESGIYGGAGFMVIDDSLNPGLRTETNLDSLEHQGTAGTTSLWSSSHITQQHGSSGVPHMWEFPSLSTVAQQLPKIPEASHSSQQQTKEKKPPSKTLAKIGSAIKKTDPEEVQRQFEAREEARRRAMMSNLTFGSNPSAMGIGITNTVPTEITTVNDGPSMEQLNRNRAIAEALGVVPRTVRGYSGSLNSGWARPCEGIQLDEFGNELNTTVYPDSLILQAREKSAVLLKLEKKWKAFLADDTSASLPLNKMDRPTRAMVHEYAMFWKLHTESFDPEPRRYIHCVKLQETSAPHPFLSDAVRRWRGPSSSSSSASLMNRTDHSLQQTAGQVTEGRSIHTPLERIPLPLKPRSEALAMDSSIGTNKGLSLGGATHLNMQESEKESSRFDVLGRERPKLELQRRTLPLEIPTQEDEYDMKKDLANQKRRVEEKKRKELEELERKQRILEAAFASDDEQSIQRVDDEDSDWEEQAPLYTGDDI